MTKQPNFRPILTSNQITQNTNRLLQIQFNSAHQIGHTQMKLDGFRQNESPIYGPNSPISNQFKSTNKIENSLELGHSTDQILNQNNQWNWWYSTDIGNILVEGNWWFEFGDW